MKVSPLTSILTSDGVRSRAWGPPGGEEAGTRWPIGDPLAASLWQELRGEGLIPAVAPTPSWRCA